MSRTIAFAFIVFALVQTARAQSDLVGQALPSAPSNGSTEARFVSGLDVYDLDGTSAALANRYLSTRLDGSVFTGRGHHESEIYRTVSPSVVMVVTDSGLGSGTYIGLGDNVLTSWHVVAGFKRVGLLFKPTTEGAKPSEADFEIAEVIKIDVKHDLALLHIATVPRNVRPIALGSENDIQVGADVHAIGHPTGEAWTYTKGFISQYRKDYEWKAEGNSFRASVIQTQTPISPGNSGGPLLSDDGKLIGVNAFKATGEALNFAISVADVQRFLSGSGAAFAKAPASCKPSKLYEGRDRSNVALLVQYDTNCDGKADYSFVSPDDTTRPFTAHIDTNFDGRTDISVEDRNRDGKWDISFHDVDYDGKIDLVGYHGDGKLTPTRFEKYVVGFKY